MDATSIRQSSSFSKTTPVDVSRLDKINAIPNKATDNVLMDGLSTGDRLYLNALMDDDSSGSGEEDNTSRMTSTWSPMIQSPVTMKKRIKMLRPVYTVSLSLEDISYIRPSWGLSKGVRTIKFEKGTKKKQEPEKEIIEEDAEKSGNSKSKNLAYNYLLVVLFIIVILLIIPTWLIERNRSLAKVYIDRIRIDTKSRTMEIYKPFNEALEQLIKVHFAQGIPKSTKHHDCNCIDFEAENEKFYDTWRDTSQNGCLGCLDWAAKANLRITKPHMDNETDFVCYSIEWQSYDSLATPLIDCFSIGDEQWLGLGDIQTPNWNLNKLGYEWMPVITNLSTEFPSLNSTRNELVNGIILGSLSEVTLLSTKGIFIGMFNTDFQILLKQFKDLDSGDKMICLSAACTERCGSVWTRRDNLKRQNNILEYKICSSNTIRNLMNIPLRQRLGMIKAHHKMMRHYLKNLPIKSAKLIKDSSLEHEMMNQREYKFKDSFIDEPGPSNGINLIERTIFFTNKRSHPTLDGQSIRLYVDSIVKTGLKTSSILLVDHRWQSYVGSIKLNTSNFPKAKSLFEILHNKGFKIIFSIKPYIDTKVGTKVINQLLDTGRLCTTSYTIHPRISSPQESKSFSSTVEQANITRRRSFFHFQNQTISIGLEKSLQAPFLFRCHESMDGMCALIDLTQVENRIWFKDKIKNSELLTLEADGIQIGGTHPVSFNWDGHYRDGVSKLVRDLFYEEKIYTMSQWTGNFNYIQLAPRPFTWDALQSVLDSIFNLEALGFSLVHPGSVWGDYHPEDPVDGVSSRGPPNIYIDSQLNEKSDEELTIRWLQMYIFLPILQFNDISPIDKFGLSEITQNLVKLRKVHLIPEMKKYIPFTPLLNPSRLTPEFNNSTTSLIRPVWFNQENENLIVPEQFMVGPNILVAPILKEGSRQRDLYLPNGFWLDELRQIDIRGGKWLRNYPVELNEIAWFTRAKR